MCHQHFLDQTQVSWDLKTILAFSECCKRPHTQMILFSPNCFICLSRNIGMIYVHKCLINTRFKRSHTKQSCAHRVYFAWTGSEFPMNNSITVLNTHIINLLKSLFDNIILLIHTDSTFSFSSGLLISYIIRNEFMNE